MTVHTVQYPYELPEPEQNMLVACTVDGRERNMKRTYNIKRVHLNLYRSSTSGGEIKPTTASSGPNGERIVDHAAWGIEFVGRFRSWSEVKELLEMMRARDIEYIMYS